MSETLKKAALTGVKVAGYILVSVGITVLASTAFNDWLKIQVNDPTLFAVVNVALAALIKALQERFPSNRILKVM